MVQHILVIEDNPEIAELVDIHLREGGFKVTICHDGTAGLAEAEKGTYHALILDLMLPGTDGLTICRRLRSHNDYLPILMLTARTSELDRVLGLELGADDYLTKPFSVRELVARIRALLRRTEAMANTSGTEKNDSVIINGNLRIDRDRHEVYISDHSVDLTAREFDLLLFFASQPGRVFSRAQLLDQVWGYGHDGYEHTVNSHINRLRSKIETDPAKPNHILTVWGVGYKFADHH